MLQHLNVLGNFLSELYLHGASPNVRDYVKQLEDSRKKLNSTTNAFAKAFGKTISKNTGVGTPYLHAHVHDRVVNDLQRVWNAESKNPDVRSKLTEAATNSYRKMAKGVDFDIKENRVVLDELAAHTADRFLAESQTPEIAKSTLRTSNMLKTAGGVTQMSLLGLGGYLGYRRLKNKLIFPHMTVKGIEKERDKDKEDGQ